MPPRFTFIAKAAAVAPGQANDIDAFFAGKKFDWQPPHRVKVPIKGDASDVQIPSHSAFLAFIDQATNQIVEPQKHSSLN